MRLSGLHLFFISLLVTAYLSASPPPLTLGNVSPENTDAEILKLENWLQEARTTGTRSPEVHHNLAALYARKSDAFKASRNLLLAAGLFKSPLTRWGEIAYLREVQRSLGIQYSSIEKGHLIWILLTSTESLAALSLLGVWCFLLHIYFLKVHRTSYRVLNGLGVFFLCIVGICFIGIKNFGTLALLKSEKEVSIFSGRDKQEKMLSLPSGTLIRIKKMEEGAFQILEPVYGWVNSTDCELLNPLPFSDLPV